MRVGGRVGGCRGEQEDGAESGRGAGAQGNNADTRPIWRACWFTNRRFPLSKGESANSGHRTAIRKRTESRGNTGRWGREGLIIHNIVALHSSVDLREDIVDKNFRVRKNNQGQLCFKCTTSHPDFKGCPSGTVYHGL